MSSDLKAWLEISRPLNVVIGAVSIYIGAFVAQPFIWGIQTLLACLSGCLILVGGNVLNDYFDVEIDKINKSWRPIPSGRISKKQAQSFAIILFASGLFLAIFVSKVACLLATFAVLSLVAYAARLKGTVLLGNLLVSLLTCLAFVYGGLTGEIWSAALIPGGFAFFFHFGREIIKDIEDVEADKVNGALTLPVIFGTRRAMWLATLVFSLLIVFTVLPHTKNIYGNLYLPIVAPGVDFVLLGLIFWMWKNPFPTTLRRISFILKIDMFVGLAAILAGTLSK